MAAAFTEKKLHRIHRISQVVRDYFDRHTSVQEIPAKNLMPLFIEKGIFLKDEKKGLYIRCLLNELEKQKKLHLLKQVKVMRNQKNRHWYFTR